MHLAHDTYFTAKLLLTFPTDLTHLSLSVHSPQQQFVWLLVPTVKGSGYKC